MAAGDVQPDGSIEIEPGADGRRLLIAGRVYVTLEQAELAELHGWAIVERGVLAVIERKSVSPVF